MDIDRRNGIKRALLGAGVGAVALAGIKNAAAETIVTDEYVSVDGKRFVDAATVVVGRYGNVDYLCDGVNDSVQIQAAFDAVNAIGGGKVVIRDGTYSISTRLEIYSNTELELSKGAKLVNTSDIEMLQNANPGGADHDIYIHGGEFDGASIGATGRSGIYLFNVSNFLISNCYVHHTTGSSIRMNNCLNGLAINNIVKYPNMIGSETGPGIGVGADHGVPGGDAIYGGSSNIEISGNYISNSPGEGIDINHYSSNIIVSRNILVDNAIEGIDAGWTYNVLVTGNIIYGSLYGIRPPWGGTVECNEIHNCEKGVYVTSSIGGVAIKNNIIHEMTGQGIYIKDSDHFQITGNVVTRCGFQGIVLYNSDNCFISDNSVLDNGVGSLGNRSGIYLLAGSSSNVIQNNNCTDTQDSISKLLTSNASAGQKVIVVSDSTVFFEGQSVTVSDNLTTENNTIDTINHITNAITMNTNLSNAYTTAEDAKITGRKTQGWGIGEFDTCDYNVFQNNNIAGNSRGEGFQSFVGANSIAINNHGLNPVGNFTAPAIPTSTTPYTNTYGYPCSVSVYGGTVTAIAIDGVVTGQTSGVFTVPPGETIALTYSVAPTWRWYGL